MATWTPISKNEVETLIREELANCPDELKQVFEQWSRPLKAHPIQRHGKTEYVYVAAVRDNEAMYYEDVEDGWNFSPLSAEGEILEHWCNQDELKFALQRWLPRIS